MTIVQIECPEIYHALVDSLQFTNEFKGENE